MSLNAFFRCLALPVALLLAACSLLGGPSPSVLKLDGDQRASASLDVGQTLVLDLRNPGAGGYQFAGASFNPAVLRLESNILSPGEDRAGDFGRARFEFLALAPGRTEVVIKIHRPFEKDVPPEVYKAVDVRVGGDKGEAAKPEPVKAEPAKPAAAKPEPVKSPDSGSPEQEAPRKGGWFSWFPWF